MKNLKEILENSFFGLIFATFKRLDYKELYLQRPLVGEEMMIYFRIQT